MSYHKQIILFLCATPVIAYYSRRVLVELYHRWTVRSTITIYNKKIGIVSYLYKGSWYKMFIPIKRGPPRIAFIKDKSGNDVTDVITPFLGPGGSISHSPVPVTPKMLGYDNLYFYMLSRNESYSFEWDTVIPIPGR